MINIKTYQKKINNKYPKEDLTVLEYKGAKGFTSIKCNSCGTVYEYTKGETAIKKSKIKLCHTCADKKRKYDDFLQRLKDLYPQDDLEIINFTKREEPCLIKCKICETVYEYQKAFNALNKTRNVFCTNCFPIKQDLMEKSIKRFEEYLKKNTQKWELKQSLDGIHSSDVVKCKCLYCGRDNYKTIYDYMRNRGCFCQTTTEPKTTKIFKSELDDDYELLSEYNGANNKVLLKHICGFTYSVTPHNYLCGKRCPKCSRKQSKGEKAIREFLENNNIKFIQEYPEKIDGHLLRFDFYLPQLNLYIEYNGEQHYNPISFFGGEERFKKQQKYDMLKQNFCKDNLLVISYKDFDNIDQILSSTTISKESTS